MSHPSSVEEFGPIYSMNQQNVALTAMLFAIQAKEIAVKEARTAMRSALALKWGLRRGCTVLDARGKEFVFQGVQLPNSDEPEGFNPESQPRLRALYVFPGGRVSKIPNTIFGGWKLKEETPA